MSRLELPLAYGKLRTTGDVVLRAELDQELKTNQGTWENTPFLVDSRTEMTTMMAVHAKDRNLPMPRRPVPRLAFQGREVRSGLLRARIVGMNATEYIFPCYFLGDPDVPVSNPRNLLGLSGVINQIRFIFDGTTSLAAPHGVLVVEKR
jgi:hypothetical protein